MPTLNQKTTSFSVMYYIVGTKLGEFNWWESIIYNDDKSFNIYFYVVCACGGVIVILLFTAIIWGIVKCCRGSSEIKQNPALNFSGTQKGLQEGE